MRMPHAAPGLVCALLAGSTLACSRDGGTAGAPANAPVKLLDTPNPATVALSVDTSLAMTTLVSARGGGEVAAIDRERGLMFMLTVPPNALLVDERITMTPVTAVGGLPLSGGLTGAVRLEPEGLPLASPATLRIVRLDFTTARSSAPSGPQIGFAAANDGRELRLAVAASDSATTVHITRLGTHGAGSGTAADVEKQLQHAPSDAAAQYAQRIAAVIERASLQGATASRSARPVVYAASMGTHLFSLGSLGRRAFTSVAGAPVSAGSAAGDPGTVSKSANPAAYDEFVKLHQGYYRDVVRPALAAAAGSYEALVAGFYAYTVWLREYQLRGGGDDELRAQEAEGRGLLRKALETLYAQAVARCAKGVDLGAVGLLVNVSHFSHRLGYQEGELFPDLNEQIDRCTAIEVVFESKIDFYWADGVTQAHDVVRATVPLEFDLARGAFEGSAPLEYVSATGVGDGRTKGFVGGCLVRTVGPSQNGTFTVRGLSLATNPKKDVRAAVGDSIALLIDPGRPQARYRAEQCSRMAKVAEGTVNEGDGWRPGWEDHHRAEQLEWKDGAAHGLEMSESAEPELVWLIDKWDKGTGAVLARRTFDAKTSNQLARSTERTTLELRRRGSR